VITSDGERERVVDLFDRPDIGTRTEASYEWMRYVEEVRGWMDRRHIHLFDPTTDEGAAPSEAER
jgi:hypothetical protein